MSKFSRQIRGEKNKYSIELEILEFQEDGFFIAFCVPLNMVGYGKSEEEAREGFEAVLSDYIGFGEENGCLHEDLVSLGWTFSEKENKPKPPRLVDVIPFSDQLREIMMHDYKMTTHVVQLV